MNFFKKLFGKSETKYVSEFSSTSQESKFPESTEASNQKDDSDPLDKMLDALFQSIEQSGKASEASYKRDDSDPDGSLLNAMALVLAQSKNLEDPAWELLKNESGNLTGIWIANSKLANDGMYIRSILIHEKVSDKPKIAVMKGQFRAEPNKKNDKGGSFVWLEVDLSNNTMDNLPEKLQVGENEILLFQNEESFLKHCSNKGYAALNISFKEFLTVVRREHTPKIIGSDARLLCDKCLKDMPLSYILSLGNGVDLMSIGGGEDLSVYAQIGVCPWCRSSKAILLWDRGPINNTIN